MPAAVRDFGFALEALEKITSRRSTPQLVVFHVRRAGGGKSAQISFLVPEKQQCIALVGERFAELKAEKRRRREAAGSRGAPRAADR
jgi:hypothetical protein